jgi:hypothetical protein
MNSTVCMLSLLYISTSLACARKLMTTSVILIYIIYNISICLTILCFKYADKTKQDGQKFVGKTMCPKMKKFCQFLKWIIKKFLR